jgi:hypothetical protein
MIYLMVIAFFGFALSLGAHIGAILGREPLLGEGVWLLHVGMFVVWIPPFFIVLRRLKLPADPSDFWAEAMRGAPAWMRWLFPVLAAACVVDGLLAFAGPKSEYTELRFFSAAWIFLYAAAFVVLYSLSNQADQ